MCRVMTCKTGYRSVPAKWGKQNSIIRYCFNRRVKLVLSCKVRTPFQSKYYPNIPLYAAFISRRNCWAFPQFDICKFLKLIIRKLLRLYFSCLYGGIIFAQVVSILVSISLRNGSFHYFTWRKFRTIAMLFITRITPFSNYKL